METQEKPCEYHVFWRWKTLKSGKKVRRWYYYWKDDTGIEHQKSCGKKNQTRNKAETYVRTLPPPPETSTPLITAPTVAGIYTVPARNRNSNFLVKDLAAKMFIPGSAHVQRRQQLKKSTSIEVLTAGRRFMKHITKVWGERPLATLELDEVMAYIFSVDRSGSWKNQYIQFLNEIYQESQFLGAKIFKPDFPSIGRTYNKADIFTEAELERLFKPGVFLHDFFFLFFLTSLSGGLRLGEIRALRVKQIIFEKKAVIIDGFLKDDNVRRTTYNKCGSPEHPKLRVVPYPDLTLSLLKAYIKKEGRTPDDYVFLYDGKPISKSMAERNFTVGLINAGITYDIETLKKKKYWKAGHIQKKKDIIPGGRRLIHHSLRYTYITRMSLDVDAHNLKQVTGHDAAGMVDYYNRKNLEMALQSMPNIATATRALLPPAIKAV